MSDQFSKNRNDPSADEILLLYGRAVFAASLLERKIALLLSGNDPSKLDNLGRDRYSFFLDEDAEKRFSPLMDRLSVLVALGDNFETDLKYALRERNRLLHGFWWEHGGNMETGRGRSILRGKIAGSLELFNKLRCYLEGSMLNDKGGPIEHFSWGKFVIRGVEHAVSDENTLGAGKDIRIVGKVVSPWNERKGHRLSPSMITGIYDKGVEVLIIGIGVDGLLECPDDVRSAIYDNGIHEIILERTHEACRLYNDIFRSGKKVALLAHGTC